MMTKTIKAALLASAMIGATSANAAAILKLEYIQRTGVAPSNAPIDIWVRLTAEVGGDALATGPDRRPTSGYDLGTYTGPIDLNDPNTQVFLNVYYSCSGSFWDGCNGPNAKYDFAFNFNAPNLIAPANFDLQPGQSYDYLLGSFTPKNGNAPAGTYLFHDTGVNVQFFNPGADPNDPNDDQRDSVLLTQTCPGQDDGCAFTRDVFRVNGAVPEPATWAMMIGGFGAIGGTMRYRRRRTAISFA
jgi:PEP-CTERM motif